MEICELGAAVGTLINPRRCAPRPRCLSQSTQLRTCVGPSRCRVQGSSRTDEPQKVKGIGCRP
eukprot:103847-Chlamydomonas_euryale.AAC.1